MSATDFWIAEDPEPLAQDSSQDEKKKYKEEVDKYCEDMYNWFKNCEFNEEPLWVEVCNTFCEHTIRAMSRTMVLNWIQLLMTRGVHVNRARHIRRVDALVQCLKSTTFIPLTYEEDLQPKDETPKVDILNKEQQNEEMQELKIQDKSKNKTIDEEQDMKSSSTEDYKASDSKFYNNDTLGINGLIKSYQGRKKFSGSWEDNLEQAISTYETFANICKLTALEKAQAIPYMLVDDAFNFYSTSIPKHYKYEETIEELKKWYTSDEKRARTLTIGQNFKLSKEMEKAPDKSEIDVFRSFSFKLTTLQKQLSTHYHHDDFLRAQYITSVDNHKIQQSLRERIPASSQEAANRITTFLSDEPGSAASFKERLSESEAMYSLGMKYGGEAESINSRHGKKNYERRLSSKWIKGIKGCYVCGKNHRAATRHSPQQVREAIRKLKHEHPSALLSVEDMVYISEELIVDKEDKSESDDDKFEDNEENYYATVEEKEVNNSAEVFFSNQSFRHGSCLLYTSDAADD